MGRGYLSYESRFENIKAGLIILNFTMEDMFHNSFLQGLGTWESEFISAQLDIFFATGCGYDPIRNLDLNDLMRRPTSSGSLQVLNLSEPNWDMMTAIPTKATNSDIRSICLCYIQGCTVQWLVVNKCEFNGRQNTFIGLTRPHVSWMQINQWIRVIWGPSIYFGI
jgi:hypothetical protein